MKKMIKEMFGKLKENKGATMVEYALMVAAIAIVAMIGAKALGVATDTLFDNVAAVVK